MKTYNVTAALECVAVFNFEENIFKTVFDNYIDGAIKYLKEQHPELRECSTTWDWEVKPSLHMVIKFYSYGIPVIQEA